MTPEGAPANIPPHGFYYHYKHKKNGAINNYAYEIFGAGHHTGNDCRPEDEYQMVYRPLCPEALVCRMGKLFDLRPLEMAKGTVVVHGEEVPRFSRVTDPALPEKLKKIRAEMYPTFERKAAAVRPLLFMLPL